MPDAVLELSTWKGLNKEDPSTHLEPGQLVEAENVRVTHNAGLRLVEGHNEIDSGYGTVLGFFHWHHQGTIYRVVVDSNGNLYVNGQKVKEGFSTTAQVAFTRHSNYLLLTNGVDSPMKFDGANFTALGFSTGNLGTVACVAAVGTLEVKTIHNMNSGWTLVGNAFQSSASVILAPGGGAEASATIAAALDLSTFDSAAATGDQDYMHLTMNFDGTARRESIEYLDLYLDTGDGTFATDYFHARLTPADLPDPLGTTDQEVYVRRSRFFAAGAAAWNSVNDLKIAAAAWGREQKTPTPKEQKQIDKLEKKKTKKEEKAAKAAAKGNTKKADKLESQADNLEADILDLEGLPPEGDPIRIDVANWRIIGGFNCDGQPLKYTVTVGDGTDESSGAQVVEITAYRSKVDLSSIIIGGAGVTQRKVYRKDPLNSDFKLVTTIADNTTTTYTDNIAIGSLGAAIRAATTKPAPIATFAVSHYDRVVWGNLDTGPHHYNWSGTGADFSTTTVGPEPISTPDDAIQGLAVLGEVLYLFTREAIYALHGTGGDNFYERRSFSARGCAAPLSIAVAGRVIYFLSDDGLYVFDGYQERKVGGNLVDDIFDVELNRDQITKCAGVFFPRGNVYMLAYPSLKATANDRVLVWDIETQAFTELDLEVDAWHHDPIAQTLYFATPDGEIMEWDARDDFAEADIPWELHTGGLHMGSLHVRKRFLKMSVEADTEETPIEVQFYAEDRQVWKSAEWTPAGRERRIYQLPSACAGKWCSVRIIGDGGLQHVGLKLKYHTPDMEEF